VADNKATDDIQKKLDDFEQRLKKLETKRVNDVANGINDVSGTISNSYAAPEATFLITLGNGFNKLLQNLRGQ